MCIRLYILFSFIILSVFDVQAQNKIKTTIVLQDTKYYYGDLQYLDSTLPVFLFLTGQPLDTVSITLNYDNSRRILILNELGVDTLMIPKGNHVMPIVEDINPSTQNKFWTDTQIYHHSITIESKYPVKIYSFEKGIKYPASDSSYIWENDDFKWGGHFPSIGLSNYTRNFANSKPLVSYTLISVNNGGFGNKFYGSSSFIVVAQSDSTIISIIPSRNLISGEIKGVQYKYLLNKGEYFYGVGLEQNADLTGSVVRSVNCKPILCYSGTYNARREILWKLSKGLTLKPFLENDFSWSRSFHFSEITPDQSYVRKYVVPVFSGNEEGGNLGANTIDPLPYHTVVQVVALFDNTKVKINKRPITLSKKGDTDGDTLQTSGYIEADKPIAVMTYVGGIRGPFNISVPAFPFDEISADTMRIACMFHKDSITKPRKWKKPIAWVLAKGDAYGATVYANGRKKVFTTRAVQIPGNFYFDTILLEGNKVNWIHSPYGAYIQYAQELMGTGSQNVSTEGAIYKPKWLQIKVDGNIVTAAQGLPRVCQNSPVKLEALTDWYKAQKVAWTIQGKSDSGRIITCFFKDTGIQTFMLRTLRPEKDCNQQEIWDTTYNQLYVYPIPRLQAQSDTTVCAQSAVTFTANYSDIYAPRWQSSDSVICSACKSVQLLPTKATTMMLQIQKPGCALVTDTFDIGIYDSLQFKITGSAKSCYGARLEYTVADTGKSLVGSVEWHSGETTDTLRMVAKQSLQVYAKAVDLCYGTQVSDTLSLVVSDALQILLPADTLICYGSLYSPVTQVLGGDTFSRSKQEWNGDTIRPSFSVTKDTMFMVTVTDGCSVPDTAYHQVRVKHKPTVSFNGVPTEWCYEAKLNVQISASQNPMQIKWRQGNDSILWLNQNQAVHSTKLMSNESIYISAQNQCGLSDTMLLPSIPNSLNLTVLSKNQVCRFSDTIKGSVAGGLGPVRVYIYGNRTDSVKTNGAFEYVNSPADSTLLLVAMDGCSIPDSVQLNRKISSELKFILADTAYSCPENELELKAYALGGLNQKRQWKISAEGNEMADSMLRYKPKANHVAYVQVADGCESIMDSVLVLVAARTQYSYTAADTMVCSPYELSIISNRVYEPSMYSMDFGNGKQEVYRIDVGDQLQIQHVYDKSGSFIWQLHEVFGSIKCNEKTGKIQVLPNPVADFVFTPQVIDVSTPEVKFIYTGSGAAMVNWSYGNGQSGNGVEVVTRYPDTGWYEVKQTVQNATGCKDSIAKRLYVSGILLIYMPTAINPSGVNQTYLPDVYNGTLLEMQIYNRWGQLIYSGNEAWSPQGSTGEVFICVARFVDRHGKKHSSSSSFTVIR